MCLSFLGWPDPEPGCVKGRQEQKDHHGTDRRSSDQGVGHGTPEDGVRQRDEGEHGGQRGQDDRSGSLDGCLDDSAVVIEAGFAVFLDLLGQDQGVAHQDARQPDQPEDGVEAERLVEQGKNVVILLDSLTKLTRAYQATLTQGGRAMTNTVTPAALVRPKRFFGAARNTRDGGSLTVIATILVDTGSRVDDIIFEEFKGTANMELWLDIPEDNEPMFPVIDMQKSGTRKEDMLLNDQEVEGLKAIRTVLGSATNREALSQLIDMMEKTKSNADLLNRLKEWVALWEKSGYLIRNPSAKT